MTIEIKILDTNGEVVAFHSGDAMRPLQFKTLPEKPLVEEIKDNEGKVVAEYRWFGLVVQPLVKLTSKETY